MSSQSSRVKRNLMLSSCVVAIGACLTAQAFAASPATTMAASAAPAASSVQAVIVTAERRSVDIQKSPLSITAVPAKTLDQSFINNLAGLNATVPSLEITKASGFENLVTIRGVGSETPENALTTVPGVSMFIDGVYVSNTVALDQTLFDINNIQVLRGPQGSLYGESSIGGAIIIETQQPKLNVFEGKGDFSFGNYNLFRERAAVNLPLGENFAARVSVQKFDHKGFTKDAAIPGFDLDDAHDGSGKIALLWKPTDRFTATFTAQGSSTNQHGDAQKNTNQVYDPTQPGGIGHMNFEPSTDPRVVNQDYPAHFKLTTQLYHLNLEYDTDWFAIKSVTAYQDLNHVQQEDDTRSTFANEGSYFSPFTVPPFYNNTGFVFVPGFYNDVAAWNTHVQTTSQELDFQSLPSSPVEWDVGAFYMKQKTHQFVAEFAGSTAPTPASLVPPAGYPAPPGSASSNTQYGNDSHAQHDSYAFFAQVGYHFTPQFRVAAGARINDDDNINPSRTCTPSCGDSDFSTRNVVPTWRAEADYDVTPDNMVYASISRGYKPGGVNGKNGGITTPQLFEPETNDAYEIGSKNYFLDRSLRLNASAFYYNHKNFQYIEADPSSVGGISNVPKIRDYGVEFEGAYTGMDSKLHIDGNVTIENGEITSDYYAIDTAVANYVYHTAAGCAYSGQFYSHACWQAITGLTYGYDIHGNTIITGTTGTHGAETNLKGKTPPAMPKYAGSIAASYRFELPTGALTPRLEVVYRGAEWARIFDLGAIDFVPAYTVTNLNIEYAPANSKLRVSLTATNLFNVNGINAKYTNPYGVGQTSAQYIPPQQVIGTVAFAF